MRFIFEFLIGPSLFFHTTYKVHWSNSLQMSSILARNSPFKVNKWGVQGSNPGHCIYYAMSLLIKLSSWKLYFRKFDYM